MQDLTNQAQYLTNKDYILLLWQSFKNIEYYIIQNVTQYDDETMNKINTNLNSFLKEEKNKKYEEEKNKKYEEEINIFKNKFNFEVYSKNLGRIKRNRLNIAHPDPIDLKELKRACEVMKTSYMGIEELYNDYLKVSDYFYNKNDDEY